MITYLIKYKLQIWPYMSDNYYSNRMILIEAESETKAEETLEAYWKTKDSEYSITYSVHDVEIFPSIKQTDYLK